MSVSHIFVFATRHAGFWTWRRMSKDATHLQKSVTWGLGWRCKFAT